MAINGVKGVRLIGYSKAIMTLPAGALVLLAIEILCLGLIGFSFLVLQVTWGQPPISAGFVSDPAWTVLCGITLVLGSGVLWFATLAARQRYVVGTILVGIACLYGLTAISLRVVDIGGQPEPNYIDAGKLAGMSTSKPRQQKKVSAAVSGKAEDGKPLYLATCAACHGPAGQGIAGTAPAYSATDFVSKSDEITLARMIQRGRSISDPENKSKRAMPSQGGNPFLTPQNVRDIAAFIKTFQTTGTVNATATNQTNVLTIPNWIIPQAALGATGLNAEGIRHWSEAQRSISDSKPPPKNSNRRELFVLKLFQAWSITHLIHLATAAMGLLMLFGGTLSRERKWLDVRQVQSAALWWHLGTGSWLLFSTLFFLMR